MLLYMYIAPRQGQTTPWGQMLMSTESPYHFAHLLHVLKTISLKYDFKHILNAFIHVNSPSPRAKKTLGDKLLMSTESPYHFDHLLQVSNKFLWILILYTFFNVFPYVYGPRAGADNLLWTKSWCQQKSLVTLPICCKFQKNIFEVWFYT